MRKSPEGHIRISAAAARLDFSVSLLGHQHNSDVPQGKITRSVEQHQPEQGPPTFLPMNESETVRPTPERESVEAASHQADDPGQGETHGHDGSSPIHRESAGGADMGMGDDVPQ